MNRAAQKPIDLNRRFLDLTSSPYPELDTGAYVRLMAQYAPTPGWSLYWSDLLEHPYTVVLGEAGTGKTTEFKRQAKELADEGEAAFFVDLTSLAREGMPQCLDPDDEERMDRWLESAEPATFFLDSLDEARLRNETLESALRRLRRALRGSWKRTRLVISCRVSDWRFESDQTTIEDLIPEESDLRVRVVHLAPLDSDQVLRLAEHHGVLDVEAFVYAIHENHAEFFVERPLDVIWLAQYWQAHRQIPGLLELMADNIREKLEERRGRATALSRLRAEDGARALAGISLLTRKGSLLLPDTNLDSGKAEASLDPRHVLGDWTPELIEHLLGRALFDEATYGRVRFHHRSVQEYLAARWLADLRDAGLDRGELEEILLVQDGDRWRAREHLAPVVAWLCLWDDHLREKIIRDEPAVLIMHGDPAALNDQNREALLRSYAATYEGRQHFYDRFERASLDRFASPAMKDTIIEILSGNSIPDELKSLLLRLVEHGRIEECVPIALEVALDPATSDSSKFFAIRAVGEAGDQTARSALLSLVDTRTSWSADLAGVYIGMLFPDPLPIPDLLKVVSQVERIPSNTTTVLHVVLRDRVPRVGSPALRLDLLQNLLALIVEIRGDTPTASRVVPEWMLQAFAHLFTAVLVDCRDCEILPSVLLQSADLYRGEVSANTYYCGLDDVRKAIAQHPIIRRALFWRRVQGVAAEGKSVPTRYIDLGSFFGDVFEVQPEDRVWLAQDAETRQDVREQLLAFDALDHSVRQGGAEDRMEVLREVAKTSGALRKRLARMFSPRGINLAPAEAQWRREEKARCLREEREQKRLADHFATRVEDIRKGIAIRELWCLYQKGLQLNPNVGSTDVSESAIRELYGDHTADAFLEGCRSLWRCYDPALPHERSSRREFPVEIVLGLFGLDLEVRAGLELRAIGAELASRAIKYAACNMNEFPEWFGQLTSRHSEFAKNLLEETICADYQHPEDAEVINDVLAKLSRAEPAVSAFSAPLLSGLLVNEEPPSILALREALSVVLSAESETKAPVLAIMMERCRAARMNAKRFSIWWCSWLGQDGEAAVDFLEHAVRELVRAEAQVLLEEICHTLRVDARLTRVGTVEPRPLARLIPLLHELIRPEDDVVHERVHSVERRDSAQDMRDHVLVQWVSGFSSPAAVKALREIAEDSRVSHRRELILKTADQCAAAAGVREETDSMNRIVSLYLRHGTEAVRHLRRQGLKVLFLASNPCRAEDEILALDEEAREIQDSLDSVSRRAGVEFVTRWAVRPEDLQRHLLDHRPAVVHFSGHGGGTPGLVFHSASEDVPSWVTSEPLSNLFSLLGDSVRLVVLNACFSDEQANALVGVIDCVVGMSDAIGDRSARVFAAAFYRALVSGRSVSESFTLGLNDLELQGMRKEARIPRLLVRDGVHADSLVLAGGSTGSR